MLAGIGGLCDAVVLLSCGIYKMRIRLPGMVNLHLTLFISNILKSVILLCLIATI